MVWFSLDRIGLKDRFGAVNVRISDYHSDYWAFRSRMPRADSVRRVVVFNADKYRKGSVKARAAPVVVGTWKEKQIDE